MPVIVRPHATLTRRRLLTTATASAGLTPRGGVAMP
jgi:hypothetical protein